MYYLVSTHPEILSRIRAEHDEFFGTDLDTTIATLTNSPEVLNKLTFTSAVIKETLRLFPIGIIVREAAPGATLTYKGRTYPIANHMIGVSTHLIQRSADFWSDPNAFDPDRWLKSENRDEGQENGSWQPFERGPRNCIGQQLALIEMKIIAVLTLRWFDFETRFREDAASIPGWGGKAYQIFKLTARPVDGMPMVAKLRDA
jgi:cytochrome P450